jgi:nucleotide-binding universal stress UspA family protein
MFKKLGLALTFSPTGKSLIYEAKRLAELFGAEIVFIHNGERITETEDKLNSLISSVELNNIPFSIEWIKGDVADTIIQKSQERNVDLLISGALEKENLFKQFFGSVARKIIQEAKCSTLILTSPSNNAKGFKKFFVSVEFSPQGENAILTSFNFALKENAEEFLLIKDIYAPALSLTMQGGSSSEDLETQREKWIDEEEEKMKFFVKELGIKGLKIKFKCLYGKEGWASSNFARSNKADIFVIPAPTIKIRLLDKFFPHEFGFTYERLPSNLLIIR